MGRVSKESVYVGKGVGGRRQCGVLLSVCVRQEGRERGAVAVELQCGTCGGGATDLMATAAETCCVNCSSG